MSALPNEDAFLYVLMICFFSWRIFIKCLEVAGEFCNWNGSTLILFFFFYHWIFIFSLFVKILDFWVLNLHLCETPLCQGFFFTVYLSFIQYNQNILLMGFVFENRTKMWLFFGWYWTYTLIPSNVFSVIRGLTKEKTGCLGHSRRLRWRELPTSTTRI